MRDLRRIIGAAPLGVSTFLEHDERGYALIVLQQKRVVADAEANAMQQILGGRWRDSVRQLAGGAGWLARATPANGSVPHVAILHQAGLGLCVIIDGVARDVRGADGGTTLTITLEPPPVSGSRMDLIYVEAWAEEVQPASSPEPASTVVWPGGNVRAQTSLANDLIVVSPPAETSRRVQWRYEVKRATGATTLDGLVSAEGGEFGVWQAAADQPGAWVRGDGSASAAAALGTVDGYRWAVPLGTITRTAGVNLIAASDLQWSGRVVKLEVNAGSVDGFSASASPTANTLLALDGSGRYPAGAFASLPGSATNAELVDGFSASASPAANTLLPLDSTARHPNSVLRTGHSNGLNADTVDAFHASASPAANTLLPLDASKKYPNSVLRTGHNNGLAVDGVDGFHAAAGPIAGRLVALDSSVRYHNAVWRTGHTNGMDADTVDGFHVLSAPMALGPTLVEANTLVALDASARIPTEFLRTGPSNGLVADTVDGLHASAFALATHYHAGVVQFLSGASMGRDNTSGTGVAQGSLELGYGPVYPNTTNGRYYEICTVVIDFGVAVPSEAEQVRIYAVGGFIHQVVPVLRAGKQTLTLCYTHPYANTGEATRPTGRLNSYMSSLVTWDVYYVTMIVKE